MTCIRMLSTAEASERLGVSQRTLIRWRQTIPGGFGRSCYRRRGSDRNVLQDLWNLLTARPGNLGRAFPSADSRS